MGIFMVVVLALAIIVLIAALLYAVLSKRFARLPYRKSDHLLTPAERSFFGVLRQAIDNDLYVFAKVRLSDLLWLPQSTRNRQSHMNRIQSKHVDFVLCDRATTEPRLLIELDDSSHRRAARQSRDAFLDQAANQAGLPILRAPVKHSYSVAELRQVISSLLKGEVNVAEPVTAEEKNKD
jgi:very-short-patch-repair endonuclease